LSALGTGSSSSGSGGSGGGGSGAAAAGQAGNEAPQPCFPPKSALAALQAEGFRPCHVVVRPGELVHIAKGVLCAQRAIGSAKAGALLRAEAAEAGEAAVDASEEAETAVAAMSRRWSGLAAESGGRQVTVTVSWGWVFGGATVAGVEREIGALLRFLEPRPSAMTAATVADDRGPAMGSAAAGVASSLIQAYFGARASVHAFRLLGTGASGARQRNDQKCVDLLKDRVCVLEGIVAAAAAPAVPPALPAVPALPVAPASAAAAAAAPESRPLGPPLSRAGQTGGEPAADRYVGRHLRTRFNDGKWYRGVVMQSSAGANAADPTGSLAQGVAIPSFLRRPPGQHLVEYDDGESLWQIIDDGARKISGMTFAWTDSGGGALGTTNTGKHTQSRKNRRRQPKSQAVAKSVTGGSSETQSWAAEGGAKQEEQDGDDGGKWRCDDDDDLDEIDDDLGLFVVASATSGKEKEKMQQRSGPKLEQLATGSAAKTQPAYHGVHLVTKTSNWESCRLRFTNALPP